MFKEDFIGDSKTKPALQKGKYATIQRMDGDGDALLDLGDGRTSWVLKKNFDSGALVEVFFTHAFSPSEYLLYGSQSVSLVHSQST